MYNGYNLTTSYLGKWLTEMPTYVHKMIATRIFLKVLVLIVKNWKLSRHLWSYNGILLVMEWQSSTTCHGMDKPHNEHCMISFILSIVFGKIAYDSRC
jgi:hypothetical protein